MYSEDADLAIPSVAERTALWKFFSVLEKLWEDDEDLTRACTESRGWLSLFSNSLRLAPSKDERPALEAMAPRTCADVRGRARTCADVLLPYTRPCLLIGALVGKTI